MMLWLLQSHSEILPYFTKGRNRAHFTSLLVERLIDERTRIKSNVRGKKRPT